MNMKHIDQENRERAVRHYVEGVQIKDIKDVDHFSLYRELKRRKIPLRGRHAHAPRNINGTPEAEVINMFRRGMTMQGIGDALGCSKQRVHQVLKRAGVDTTKGGGRKTTKERHQAIINAAKAGTGITGISKATGFGEEYVKKILSRNGRFTPWARTAALRCARTLKKLYQKSTATDIARRLGCNLYTVLNHLKRLGVAIRSCQTKAKSLKATQLYDRAWLDEQLKTRTRADIGRQFGVHGSTVFNIMKRIDNT